MNTLLASPETAAPSATSFWARLLQDESMQPLDHLEQILTGCEIIAALDDLDLLGQFSS